MNAQEIIDYIANSEKKTPVKVYVNTTAPVDFGSAKVFGSKPAAAATWFRRLEGAGPHSGGQRRTRSPTAWWKTTAATPACPCWT